MHAFILEMLLVLAPITVDVHDSVSRVEKLIRRASWRRAHRCALFSKGLAGWMQPKHTKENINAHKTNTLSPNSIQQEIFELSLPARFAQQHTRFQRVRVVAARADFCDLTSTRQIKCIEAIRNSIRRARVRHRSDDASQRREE